MRKRVEQVDTESGTRTELATFTLEGDRVTASWASEAYRQEVDLMGIYLDAHGDVRPEDGPVFLEALDAAYERSSLRYVVEA